MKRTHEKWRPEAIRFIRLWLETDASLRGSAERWGIVSINQAISFMIWGKSIAATHPIRLRILFFKYWKLTGTKQVSSSEKNYPTVCGPVFVIRYTGARWMRKRRQIQNERLKVYIWTMDEVKIIVNSLYERDNWKVSFISQLWKPQFQCQQLEFPLLLKKSLQVEMI